MSNLDVISKNVKLTSGKKRRNRRINKQKAIGKKNSVLLKQYVDEVRVKQRRNARRPPRRQRQQNQGGVIDRFPLGNMQGQNFRANKRSNEVDMEYIGEVVSNSTGFSVLTSYAVNPGQSSTFPWLSKKAILYEKYQFKGLEFVYKPQVSQFASLGTTGKVILSFDYDASDPAPTSKQQMEDTDPSADGMPYQEICLKMRPRDLHKNSDAKFVRPGGLPGGSDIKTYDCGILNIAISGIEANSGTLGELWVRYNCVLTVPVLESTSSAPSNFSVTSLFDNAAALTTTVNYQALLAAANSTTVVNVNGIGVVNTAGSIVPPPGNYILDVDSNFLYSALSTKSSMLIQKNGNTQNVGVVNTYPSGYSTGNELHQSIYISCNGTDAITVILQGTFSTGTASVSTTFRLTAI